jgi:hypothetical protein
MGYGSKRHNRWWNVHTCTYLVFAIRVEVVEVGGVPAGHVMQEERDGEIRREKSTGKE